MTPTEWNVTDDRKLTCQEIEQLYELTRSALYYRIDHGEIIPIARPAMMKHRARLYVWKSEVDRLAQGLPLTEEWAKAAADPTCSPLQVVGIPDPKVTAA